MPKRSHEAARQAKNNEAGLSCFLVNVGIKALLNQLA
ncbi:Conserved hypothetical protein [Prochlorococcus marinus str. MIT 9313]|uniref:Uncharacterized protein n=1 Tax=Prochlorococcus marinus (strain MIT 9313) TaxID=74547 RepID=B9ERL7_PROMM|nr:Conserved hypothetical protein [Prochlorococcus marinus str. MIT 9313]